MKSRRKRMMKGKSYMLGVANNNSHKTRNSIRSSKTRSSNTGSSIDTGRASTTSVNESEGQCPEALYLYC
jgi:hypothetical protein